MQIVLITPAPPGSKAGNRATAERWALLLEQEGHRVHVATEFGNKPCDLLIALHAWRSHEAIRKYRDMFPENPLIVALTGTDIYHHQHSYPEQTLYSMDQADCLIGLHKLVSRDIPARFAQKLVTVLQSAEFAARKPGTSDDVFTVCVIGHLRQEKDPFRAAVASWLLPTDTKVRIINAGKAHTMEWATAAEKERAANPRFQWLGEIGRPQTRELMQHSDIMVISSVMEGGANVVSEACRMGLPILASDIPGNVGLLGAGYPGYFRVGDEHHLAERLLRAEQSSEYLNELATAVSELGSQFTPENEQASLRAAVTLAVTQR